MELQLAILANSTLPCSILIRPVLHICYCAICDVRVQQSQLALAS